MKVFVSQPMNSIVSEDIILHNMYAMQCWVRLTHHDCDQVEVIDNYHMATSDSVNDNQRVWLLGQTISLMASADLVIFMDGYEKANGCMIELGIVEKYGIKHIFESDLKNMVKERLNELGEAVCEE